MGTAFTPNVSSGRFEITLTYGFDQQLREY